MKYTFDRNTGRIRAARTIFTTRGQVAAGTQGGIISSPRNLSQNGECWVFANGSVSDYAIVSGGACVVSGSVGENARVYGESVIDGGIISGFAKVAGMATVSSGAKILGNAHVYGHALVSGAGTYVFENAKILGYSTVQDGARVFGNASVFGIVGCLVSGIGTQVYGNVRIQGRARILRCADASGVWAGFGYTLTVYKDGALVYGITIDGIPPLRGIGAKIFGNAKVLGDASVCGVVGGDANVSGCVRIDPTSVVDGNARVAGCVVLEHTHLTGDAVVYGQEDLLSPDQVVTDASLVTNCPERVSKECCTSIH